MSSKRMAWALATWLLLLVPACGGGSSPGAAGIPPEVEPGAPVSIVIKQSTNTNHMARVDLETGASEPLTWERMIGFEYVHGLAYDPAARVLIAAQDTASSDGFLFTIDLANQRYERLGAPNLPGLGDLAWDAAGQRLFAISGDEGALYLIDRATGIATEVGPTGFLEVYALAMHPTSGILYAYSVDAGVFFSIDPSTGLGTAIGTQYDAELHGMAFAPDGTLYGVTEDDGRVWVIDLATGAATESTDLGSGYFGALAYDSDAGRLVASDTDEYSLRSFAPGAWDDRTETMLATSSFRSVTYDPAANRFLGMDSLGSFYAIDATTRWTTRLATHPDLRIYGFGWDAAQQGVIGYDQESDQFVRIHAGTGAATLLPTQHSGQTFRGIAVRPSDGAVFAFQDNLNELMEIDPVTGFSTPIGATRLYDVRSMAFDPTDDSLYALESIWTRTALYQVDTGTGTVTAVAATGTGGGSGLAFDPNSNQFTFVGPDDALLTIDAATHVVRTRWGLPSRDIGGLTRNASGELFMNDSSTRSFWRWSQAHGSFELVGQSPSEVRGLAMVGTTVYASSTSAGARMGTLDPTSGAWSQIGFTHGHEPEGLAWDSIGLRLFGINYGAQELYEIDTATGTVQSITPLPIRSRALAFEPAGGFLLAWDGDGSRLAIIDPVDGSTSYQAITGAVPPSGSGMAYDATQGLLYLTTSGASDLYVIDVGTWHATQVAPLGGLHVDGLAYDSVAGVLLGATVDTGAVVTIEPSTGATTLRGYTSMRGGEGLTRDPVTHQTWGVHDAPDGITRIDSASGASETIGATGFARPHGAAFDPQSGLVYALDSDTDTLLQIDPVTGIGSGLATLPGVTIRRLWCDPSSGILYGADTASDRYVEIDPTSGTITPLGRTPHGVVGWTSN